MPFVIIHEIPGRMRLRSDIGFDFAAARELADKLDAVEGIEGVRVNPVTGSILLLYATMAARDTACLLLTSYVPEPSASSAVQVLDRAGDRFDWGPVIRYLFVRPFLPLPLRMACAVTAALPFVKKGVQALSRRKVNVDVLDASAIGISLIRRDFNTVSLLILLLGLGEALEEWTRKKSLESLAQSLALEVDTVWVRRGEKERMIPLQALEEGDQVIARAGTAIPVDGVVVAGEASVNQASMTGEPLGVLRAVGNSVFAGTVVEEGEVFIRPTGVGDGTRLRQIVRFIEESEAIKADVQGKTERLADAVVPFSFLLAGAVWLLTRNPTRAASVLMVDYSCALRLATPLAILSAMREGVNAHGILVKGGRFLEALAGADAVVFDKTGTLTESRPKVVEIVPAGGMSRQEVLKVSACLEEHFPHPVARAVVRRAEEEQLRHAEEHTEVEYVVAHGIASRLHGKRVLLGSRHYIHHDEGVAVDDMREAIADLSCKGYSILYLAIDGMLAGLIGIEDPLRPESRAVVSRLREYGIRRIVMLTGDDERTAAAMAERLGIDEYLARVLPTDKASVIRSLQEEGHTVLMVGDGINDSPALSAADVGISLRDGADLAREVADVVLADCRLSQLITALKLGKATMRRIQTNFAVTMGLNTVFLAGGLFGVLPPALSAVLHNMTTVGVSLNAMRRNLSKRNPASRHGEMYP